MLGSQCETSEFAVHETTHRLLLNAGRAPPSVADTVTGDDQGATNIRAILVVLTALGLLVVPDARAAIRREGGCQEVLPHAFKLCQERRRQLRAGAHWRHFSPPADGQGCLP